MAFPFVLRDSEVTGDDVARFAPLLARQVQVQLACAAAYCVGAAGDEPARQLPEAWQAAVAEVLSAGEPLQAEDGDGVHLFLPLKTGGQTVAVAVAAGIKPQEMVSAASGELAVTLADQLQRMKGLYTDPLTGLANGLLLQKQLTQFLTGAQEQRAAEQAVLALIELYPPSRDVERALTYVQRGGSYLTSLFGPAANLFHLGGGLFALLWDEMDSGGAQKTAALLLRRLRREDFSRAHVGLRNVEGAVSHKTVELLLDEAWQALAAARRRGPFGLCVHGQENVAASFQPLTKAEQRKVAVWWRGRDRFALVLVRQDHEAVSNSFTRRVRQALADSVPYLLLNQREALVFLDGAGRQATLHWAKQFRQRMTASAGSSFSMGLALYPALSFTKAQMPVNCRKALLHAEFFGPDAQALFDGVSCNISGDVYYNGGDILRAVREYRLGLAMDPGNVNLLNSLGVAYMQLKRPRMALQCFEAALRHDSQNFMALFNLGFVQLRQKAPAKALDFFERALAANDHHFDLLLQLGKLYCKQQRFAEAAKLLTRCVNDANIEERRNGDRAAAYRLLGESCAGQHENRQAIAALQKALSLNPRDPQALSMLGELYAREKEGDAIALSFCLEAVQLDAAQGEHWRRLAWVQWTQKREDEAIESLRHCLRLDRKNSAAAFWLARIYREQGKTRAARRMYEKVLRLQPNHAEAKSDLAQVGQ